MSVPHIFISHSSSDDSFGLRLCEDLRALVGEESVWYDSTRLDAGEEWWKSILAEITSRDVFLVILSPEAVASRWVNDEITIAWRQKNTLSKRIIPILLAPCLVREDLMTLQIISFIPTRPYEHAFEELRVALGLGHESKPAPTLPFPTDQQSQLTKRLIDEIHSAFGQEDWGSVTRKSSLLLEETHYLDPQLWRERGLACLALEKYEDALRAFDAYLEHERSDEGILRAKGRTLGKLGRKEEMMAIYERLLAFLPREATSEMLGILNEMVTVLAAQGLWQEALQYNNEALQIVANDQELINDRIKILIQLGRPIEAMQLETDDVAVLLALGYSCKRYGKYKEAIEIFDKVNTLGSESYESWHGIEESLWELGGHEGGNAWLNARERAASLRNELH